MSGIDWNKQPSWAKHAGVDVACGHPVAWSDECHQYEGRDAILCGPPKVSFYRIASRPEPWTGDGLPPAGEVCELRCKTGGWGVATVKYISPTVCAWLWANQPADVECCEEVHKMEFRPIRTPEQIAADQRAEAIEKMWSIYWQPHATSAKQALGLLWDAGLRFADDPDNA
jgi:hypothetical protein